MAYTPMVVLSVIVCLLSCKAQPDNEYQICGRSTTGQAFEVPKAVTCDIGDIPVHDIVVRDVDVYVPRTTPLVAPAYKCTLHTRKVCTNTGFFGAHDLVGDETTITALPTSVCRDVFESKSYKGEPLQKMDDKLWSTNKRHVVQYKWCCYTKCESTTNFFLQVGSVASADAVNVMSDLGNVAGCRASAGVCNTDTEVILWNPDAFNGLCRFQFRGTHNAQISDHNLVVINTMQAALTIKAARDICNITGALETSQGLVLVFNDSSSYKALQRNKTEADIPAMLTEGPENGKFQYIVNKLAESKRLQFQTRWLQFCTVANQRLQLVWGLLKMDATIGARAFFMRDDIYAAFAGESLMVWPCHKVRPDVIFWNQTVDGLCYDSLPVMVDGRIWFVVPLTRDLVPTALPVSCSHRLRGQYKRPSPDTGIMHWYTVQGPAHVTSVNSAFVRHGNDSKFVFDAPVMFHNIDGALTQSMSMLSSYVSRTRMLELQTSRLINYTASLSLDPDATYNVLSGAGTATAKVIQGAGKTVVHAATESRKSFFSNFTTLISGPLQLLVNVVVIGAACIGLAAALYYGLQYSKRLIRKLKSRNRSADLEGGNEDAITNDILLKLAEQLRTRQLSLAGNSG